MKFWKQKDFEVIKGHTRPVWDAQFSRDGRVLATASLDRTIILWDSITWKRSRTLEHDGPVQCISWHPLHNSLFLSGSNHVYLWNVDKEPAECILRVGTVPYVAGNNKYAVEWLPCGTVFLYGDERGGMYAHSVDGTLLAEHAFDVSLVFSIKAMDQERVLVTASDCLYMVKFTDQQLRVEW